MFSIIVYENAIMILISGLSKCVGLNAHFFAQQLVTLYFQVILKLNSNALAWNPMEAFVFTVANEDYK